MSEASVALKLIDQYSANLKNMQNANNGFNKSMEKLARQASDLDSRLRSQASSLAESKTKLAEAKRELEKAKAAYKNLNDEAKRDDLKRANQNYDDAKRAVDEWGRACKSTEKQLHSLAEQARKLSEVPNPRGGGGGSNDLIKMIKSDKTSNLVLPLAQDATTAFFGNMYGDAAAEYASSIVAGAIAGSPLGPWGTLAGVAIGAASAAINQGQKHNEYFESSVQEDYENISQHRENQVSGGSGIGSSRETLLLSYKTLMGGNQAAADELYNSLLQYANETPYTIGQLSDVGRTLLSYGYESSEIKDVINSIGSAAAATGSGAQGLSTMATVIGRLKAGEISAEQMNMLTNIGINPYQTLADQYNSEKGTSITGTEMKKLISGGKVSAQWASEALLTQWGSSWGSAMQEFSRTFEGLQSTLDGLAENRQAFVGEQYNEKRKPAMQQEIDYLTSETGKMITEIEGYYGTVQARAENTQERFRREAEEALLYGKTYAELGDEVNYSLMILHDEYTSAKNKLAWAESSGDTLAADEARIAMYNALDAARKEAEAAWTKSDLFGVIQEGQMNLIGDLQTATYDSWFDYGYQIAEALSKGAAAAALNYNPSSLVYDPDTTYVLEDGKAVPISQMRVETLDGSDAYGLHSVPYNGYIAELHQGERVPTAAEARVQDEGKTGGSVTVNIGDVTVRDPADADLLAEVIVERILEAKKTLVR
ncbi:MAG: hypothetical protein IKM36_04160 [Oscillospiraceae bacterium]|nr:hypothetical protein [Oscillospiraceae bacterium]